VFPSQLTHPLSCGWHGLTTVASQNVKRKVRFWRWIVFAPKGYSRSRVCCPFPLTPTSYVVVGRKQARILISCQVFAVTRYSVWRRNFLANLLPDPGLGVLDSWFSVHPIRTKALVFRGLVPTRRPARGASQGA
jgi:hypothetical protein